MNKTIEAKKILNKLNELDVQYLLDYPKKLNRIEYLKKRKALKSKFDKLKN